MKRICIKECQANDMNTLERRESNCTFIAGLSSCIHSVSLTRQSNLFVHLLLTLKRTKKGQNKWHIMDNPSPKLNDAKKVHFCSFVPPSLLWGKRRLIVPFYSVQDCCSSAIHKKRPAEKSAIKLKLKLVDTRKGKKLSSFFQ